MLNEQVFQTSSVAINYVEGPQSGPPLLLLHGIASRWQHFLPIIPGLIVRSHVYALDHRGHGKSERAAGTYRYLDYATDAIEFLNKTVTGQAIVFGHSLGAMVSIAVAAQAPEKVRAVILEDPPLYTTRGQRTMSPNQMRFIEYRDIIQKGLSVSEILPEMRRLLPNDDDAAHRFRASSISMLDPDALTSAIEGRSRQSYDAEALLKRIECPVLLLQGHKPLGGVMEDSESDHAASLLRDCTLVRMSDAGHQIHTDYPERTLGIVTSFLESL
jgi:pimeloyl-ACP methyl ester carboxylesterase